MYVTKENRYSECHKKVLYEGPKSVRNIFKLKPKLGRKSPARLTIRSAGSPKSAGLVAIAIFAAIVN